MWFNTLGYIIRMIGTNTFNGPLFKVATLVLLLVAIHKIEAC